MVRIGKFRISGAALVLFAAVFFFDSTAILCILSAIAVHELGHFTALNLFGTPVYSMDIDVWGLTMNCGKTQSYAREIVAAAAGPMASLLAALLASAVGRQFGIQQLYLVAGVNLVFCAFNALPAQPLDGGKILYDVCAIFFGPFMAERVSCIVSCAVIFLLLAAGTAVLVWTRTNFTLLVAAGWLLISYCKKNGISIKLTGKNDGCETWIRD